MTKLFRLIGSIFIGHLTGFVMSGLSLLIDRADISRLTARLLRVNLNAFGFLFPFILIFKSINNGLVGRILAEDDVEHLERNAAIALMLAALNYSLGKSLGYTLVQAMRIGIIDGRDNQNN